MAELAELRLTGLMDLKVIDRRDVVRQSADPRREKGYEVIYVVPEGMGNDEVVNRCEQVWSGLLIPDNDTLGDDYIGVDGAHVWPIFRRDGSGGQEPYSVWEVISSVEEGRNVIKVVHWYDYS